MEGKGVERFIVPDLAFRLELIEKFQARREGRRREWVVPRIDRKTRALHVEDERKNIPCAERCYAAAEIGLLMEPFEDRDIGFAILSLLSIRGSENPQSVSL